MQSRLYISTIKESKKHTKHTALTKPIGGDFHRNEWTLIGAPCGIVTDTAKTINEHLKTKLKIGFLDEEHNAKEKPYAFYSHYNNKISYRHIATSTTLGEKQTRKYFNELDLLLVNGNHYKGDKQIVFINDKKKDSLQRKIDRLDNIRIIVIEKANDVIFDFVLELLEGKMDVLVTDLSDLESITSFILKDFNETTAPLNGLVLAGGKSVRMGRDKGEISYHGKPQREYQADLLHPFCQDVFISCRHNQNNTFTSEYKKIEDQFHGLGPYGGILSAFREHPNHAWVTLACDLPYMNKETLSKLAASRDPRKVATCFHNPKTKFPEPLITIWEPRAYPILLEFLSQGYSCPRKVLINTDILEIEMDNTLCMTNVNDKEEYEKAIKSNKSTFLNFKI